MTVNHLQAHALGCIRGDRRLFSGLCVSLQSGELLYLQGANGAGKTTLLRTLCGLFYPDEGYVSWNDEKTSQIQDVFNRSLLYIGHQTAVKLELTPLENLKIACALQGQYIEEARLWQALDQVGLGGFEDLPAKMLSQGQQRRISLARLFVSTAPLWILDEPFNTLDTQATGMLQTVIAGHISQGGLAILTTHQEVPLTSGDVQHIRLGQ